MSLLSALASGLIGACALTVLHESVRQYVPEAPRADILGMRAIKKGMQAVGMEPPPADQLHDQALAGDILSNSLYYSLIGLSTEKNALLTGTALGLAAGVGAVALPGPMGLGTKPTNRTTQTQVMTIGWYLIGGLATAMAYKAIQQD